MNTSLDDYKQRVLAALDPDEVVAPWVHNRSVVRENWLIGECPFPHDSGRDKKRRWGMNLANARYRWKCVRCNESGDIFDLVGRLMNIPFMDAVYHLGDMAGIPRPQNGASGPAAPMEADVLRLLTSAALTFHQKLMVHGGEEGSPYAEAMAYYEKRGLSRRTIEEHKLGYVDTLPRNPKKDRDLWVATGIYHRSEQNSDYLYSLLEDCITIPVFRGSSIVNVVARRLHPGTYRDKEGLVHDKPDHLKLRPQKVFFHQEAAREPEVYVNEGALDALSYLQAGFPALAVLGATSFQRTCANRFLPGGRVYLSFDADEAGRSATHRMAEALFGAGLWDIHVVTFQKDREDDKVDANVYFRTHSREDFLARRDVAVEDYVGWSLKDADFAGASDPFDAIRRVRPTVHTIAGAVPLAREMLVERIAGLTKLPLRGLIGEAEAAIEEAEFLQGWGERDD